MFSLAYLYAYAYVPVKTSLKLLLLKKPFECSSNAIVIGQCQMFLIMIGYRVNANWRLENTTSPEYITSIYLSITKYAHLIHGWLLQSQNAKRKTNISNVSFE